MDAGRTTSPSGAVSDASEPVDVEEDPIGTGEEEESISPPQ
jgi:hypothetical protein